jgi:selenocysteine lyase/cysteine desulfurase
MNLESYFSTYKQNIIGEDVFFESPYGNKKVVYADWTASGRMYAPIESMMMEDFYPLVANTHTETNFTGTSMTLAYQKARQIIKKHVNASSEDVLVAGSSGMTGVINKFQRILGLKIHESFKDQVKIEPMDRPILFVTHMEHHSNQTSWVETICEVVIIPPDSEGNIDLNAFAGMLDKYKDRSKKIAAITSCSNVTGIKTPYFKISQMIHAYGGYCFVDFACSAPYIDIDMHPESLEDAQLDAIYFSPHKFLGGPGSSGVLIFNQKLYNNSIPDDPGGGTVDYTNPWGENIYHDSVEAREDGGTPAFLQTIRVALAIKLKESMGVDNILAREEEMLAIIWDKLENIQNVHIMADNHRSRLGVISFFIHDLHYNLGVKLLNDVYGIQVRGGCSCAGTYGHYLFEVSAEKSNIIRDLIAKNDLSLKPGWIRMSIHPTMTNDELIYILESIKDLANNHHNYTGDYIYNSRTNEYRHKSEAGLEISSALCDKLEACFA